MRASSTGAGALVFSRRPQALGRALVTLAANAAISGEERPAFHARQILIGGMSVTGTYAIPGWTKEDREGCRQEADGPAGRDVLQFLLEVVDCWSRAGLAAVGSWVDVVEGLPAGTGTALDDHGIVRELGDRDLALAGSRVANGKHGDARLRAHRHELEASVVER